MSYLLQHTRRAMLANTANGTTGAAMGTLAVDLKAFWELGEASGTRMDSHTGGLDLSPVNTPGNAAGKVGDALACVSASDQRVSRASHADLVMGDIDFSICFWAYMETVGDQTFLAKSSSGGTIEYAVHHSGGVGGVYFAVRNLANTGNGTVLAAVGSPPEDTWFFVVAWHDSVNNFLRASLNNGTAGETSFSGGVRASTLDFNLGRDFWDGFKLNGRIDQVGVWKRVLTADERTYLYNAGAGRTYAEVLAASP